jgi:aldehyde:ferredoxin oxidoreductase
LFGYVGKLLFVDLSTKEFRVEELDEALCRDYLGGYGFGVKELYDRLRPGIDPLGPENILGFITGALTGTGALITPRFMVVGKSPLTGGWGEANCGGFFGPELKKAGFDGVFISGCSAKPVYILIDDGKVEVCPGDSLWGKTTYETEDALKEMYPGSRVMSIGPAGEKCSLISAIITEKGNAAGRSGLGAVMGSKNLKALVVRGNGKIPIYDEEALKAVRKKYLPVLKEDFASALREYGTAGDLETLVEIGDTPVKNWGGVGVVDFPNAEKIGGNAIKERQVKKAPCYGCAISCGNFVKGKDGKGGEKLVHTVQYETLGVFGPLCLNEDLDSIIECNDICNSYGLDTISTGAVVAFGIECFENGILTTKETGGLELTWGNGKAIVRLTQMIAKREGIGAILADGSKLASERIGKNAKDYAMQIGGQELPAHDQRLFPGLTALYWTDATPGRHTQGTETWIPAGLNTPPFDEKEQAGRGEVHKLLADIHHVMDCGGFCLFSYFALNINNIVESWNAVTGWKVDLEDLLKSGERISYLRHAFNLREGINFMEYQFPKRLLGDPPLPEGPTAGVTLKPDVLLGEYMQAMEWDEKTLYPSKKKLEELGLGQVIKNLYQVNRN